MTTGMKKFTKGCLMTALVVFIIGAVLCGVGGLLGGFRQLNGMDVRRITGIPFVYRIGPDGFEYGFRPWDGNKIDWSGYENWDSVSSYLKDIDDINDIEGPAPALNLTADTLRNLYIEVGDCKLYIEESEDEYVRLAIDGNASKFRYHVEGDSLRLVRKSDWHWVGINWGNWGTWDTSDKIYLYLPKGTSLDYADIEVGAGYIESANLTAREFNIDVGAGVCDVDSLTADDTVMLSVGAGTIRVGRLTCDTADMDIGAGTLEIDDMVIGKEADIDLGMGSVDIGGAIEGDLNVDCSMGTVMLDLDGTEQDHNFYIDCSMGEVKVGSRSYSSLSSGVTINNGSSSNYDIDCSMGNVTVKFAR